MKIGIIVLALIFGVMFAGDLLPPSAQMTEDKIQQIVDKEVEEKIRERSEILDQRSESISWWLGILGIVIAIFGVVIPIGITVTTIFSLNKFRKLENEARSIIDKVESDAQKFKDEVRQILVNIRQEEKTIKEHSNQAKDIVDKLSVANELTGNIPSSDQEQKTAEILANQTGKAKEIITNQEEEVVKISHEVLKNPESSFVERAVAEACILQQGGNIEEAIKKWESIANIVEDSENDLAPHAWFSVGNLFSKIVMPEKALSALTRQKHIFRKHWN